MRIPFAAPTFDDEPEPFPQPAPPMEHPTARAARVRREAAERQRALRARRRAEGLPDDRVVDSAIASALSTVLTHRGLSQALRTSRSPDGLDVPLRAVLGQAVAYLADNRGVEPRTAARLVLARLAPVSPYTSTAEPARTHA